jgi:hypothetical protein
LQQQLRGPLPVSLGVSISVIVSSLVVVVLTHGFMRCELLKSAIPCKRRSKDSPTFTISFLQSGSHSAERIAVSHSIMVMRLAACAPTHAFARCAELNLYGMVDAQVAVLEGELLS